MIPILVKLGDFDDRVVKVVLYSSQLIRDDLQLMVRELEAVLCLLQALRLYCQL